MKKGSKRVTVMLELDTTILVSTLRKKTWWEKFVLKRAIGEGKCRVVQAQANKMRTED